ncbi:MAG TPA: asparaginase [Anaerolineales bacterium]|nr:asparaginase [Anaerolineales bacterium]
MQPSDTLPIFELSRAGTVESVHFGAAAVVDSTGKLIAKYGNPDLVTFLRSSAKPFQVLPLLEAGGQERFGFTPREIALMCASHSGTDSHVAVAESIQVKAGVTEADLLCGVHEPTHEPTANSLRERHEAPTPNRHNCSGKHSGMLALGRIYQAVHIDDGSLDYIDNQHPVQKAILHTFADMCTLTTDQIHLGIDGCSAPNFAVPLRNAAYGFARLCDPDTGSVEPLSRREACRTVTSAMMFNPDMVGGPDTFDTTLMELGKGRWVSKGGAEGYQALGILPGVLGHGSPGLGITLKIADGDQKSRARHAVALAILQQLGILTADELARLGRFGPVSPVLNWRKIEVGIARPLIQLDFSH